MSNQFIPDEENSNDDTFYLDIQGKGTIVILSNNEGITIEAFPFYAVDEPVYSGFIRNSEFKDDK